MMPDQATKKVTAIAERQFSHFLDELAVIVEDDQLDSEHAGFVLRMAATTLRVQASKLDPEGIDEESA